MHVLMYLCMYTHYMLIGICMYVRMYVCIYVCMYLCMYVNNFSILNKNNKNHSLYVW